MTTLETIMDLCCAPKSKNMLLIKTHFTYVGLYFKHLMAVILRNVFKRSNTTCSQLSVLLQNYILIFVFQVVLIVHGHQRKAKSSLLNSQNIYAMMTITQCPVKTIFNFVCFLFFFFFFADNVISFMDLNCCNLVSQQYDRERTDFQIMKNRHPQNFKISPCFAYGLLLITVLKNIHI